MNTSKRVFYYDCLRALAIIGIVFCHVSAAFVFKGVNSSTFYISAFFDCFRDFSIPIFVMLSGALLINRTDSVKVFFKKRLSRIFIPFLFWVLIYSIYYYLYILRGFDLSVGIDIFFGTSSTMGVTFWFVWMIVFVYMGIFLINKIMSWGNGKISGFGDKFIIILTLLSVIYIAMVHFSFFNPYNSKIIYFFSFITYCIIGFYLTRNDFLEKKISVNKLSVIMFISFVGCYLYYIFGIVVPSSIQNNQFLNLGYFNLLILAMSVSLFLFFKFISKKDFFVKMENSTVGNAISMISRCSFGIYLSHYVILNFLRIRIVRFVDYTQFNPLICIPILVITVLAISIVILWILEKIPYLNKFSGVS